MDTGARTPPGRAQVDVRRARRWFRTLTTVAVLSTGILHEGLRSPPGTGAGAWVLVGGLALTAPVLQAARILTVLTGPPHLPRRLFPHRSGDRARPTPARDTHPPKGK